MTTRDEYVGPSSEDMWASLPTSALKERLIQLCLGADGTLYGLSNYGTLYHRFQNKWYPAPSDLEKRQ